MSEKKNIPRVSKAILAIPYVKYLLSLLNKLKSDLKDKADEIEELKAELRRLKKLPKKPKIEPSKLDENKNPKNKNKNKGSKDNGGKKKKKKDLPIDEEKKVEAQGIPEDWKFVGYKPYIIQDVKVERHNIKYDREVWESPDGKQRVVARLPGELEGRQFGPVIRAYVINLYNNCHVTQPLIHQILQDIGVDISTGQINYILNEDKANKKFEEELLEVVAVGIEQSGEIRTDDTSSRHQGKNGFCNCINTDLFTYFRTTESKSRINFLKVLQLDGEGYTINEECLEYCLGHDLPPIYLTTLIESEGVQLNKEEELFTFFKEKKITAAYAQRTITEGMLLGHLIQTGFDKEKIIHADDAGQFKILNHCLCWKHSERPLKKVVIRNDIHQEQWEGKMDDFWQLYQDLKAYKEVSALAQKRRKAKLEKQFDQLCEPVKNFESLNKVVDQLKKKKRELLLVLDYPFVSLHNNGSEREIREYAKRRKISGSTRSENGRRSRDVFTSLKKTCRKLGVSFWDYTLDRIKGENKIPPLAEILLQRSQHKIC